MDAIARETTVKKVGTGAVQAGDPLYVLWTDADTQEHGKKGHPYPSGVRVAYVQHNLNRHNETFILYKCGLLQLVSQEELGQLVKKSNEILASKSVTKMQQKLRADMEPLYHESADGEEDDNDESDNDQRKVIVPETQESMSNTTKQAASDPLYEQGQEDAQHQQQQQLQEPGSEQEQLEVHDQRETIPPIIYPSLSNNPLPFVTTPSFAMSVKELREAEA